MECVFLNPYRRQFFVGPLDPGFIGTAIQLRLDMQPGFGPRVPDQVDYHGATQQRLAEPVVEASAVHGFVSHWRKTFVGLEVLGWVL